MQNNDKHLISVSINGQIILAPEHLSIVQALWHADYPRIKSVGCLEGVCGSCRVMVRREASDVVTTELACEVLIEEGMQATFLSFPEPSPQQYQLSDIKKSADIADQFHNIFPNAQNCRNCGGCNSTCPRGIDVESAVILAAQGKFSEAGDLFIECVLCDLCQSACPEAIEPNHVGLFARRVTAHFHIQPKNLIHQLEKSHRDELKIDINPV